MKKTFSLVIGFIVGALLCLAIGYTYKSLSSSTTTNTNKAAQFSWNRSGSFGSGRNRFGSGDSFMRSGQFLWGTGRNRSWDFMKWTGSIPWSWNINPTTWSNISAQELLNQNILQK